MASLTELRDAACACLKNALPAVRVSGLAGSADAATILRESVGKSTVFVVLLAAENHAERAPMDFDMQATLGALVIIHGRKNQTAREADGLAVAEAAAQSLHGRTFGMADAGPARVLGIAPLADEELENKGLWAWAVTWEQSLTFTATQEAGV